MSHWEESQPLQPTPKPTPPSTPSPVPVQPPSSESAASLAGLAEPAQTVEIVVAQPAGNRGFAKLAWGVILAIATLVIGLNALAKGGPQEKDESGGLNDQIMEFQAKLLIGWQAFNNSLGAPKEIAERQKADMYRQAQTLDEGSLSTRLRFVVLAGEMAGPDEAKKKIDALRTSVKQSKATGEGDPASTEENKLLGALSKLYGDYAGGAWEGPSLSAADRKRLMEMGWFGDLALAPAEGASPEAREAVIGPAKFAFAAIAIVGVSGVLAFSAGMVGAFLFIVLAASRKVRPSLETPSGNGGVYAETFAWWMLIFLGTSFALGFAFGGEPPLIVNVGAFLFGLVALAWPVLRGVSWKQVRSDIGWTSGKSPLLEPFYGVVGYVCSLPLMAIGVVIVSLLVRIAGSIRGKDAPPSTPTHPVVEWIGQGGWEQVAIIFLLASVCAPILEETFFRGVLYRHLRDATWRWRVGASVLFSSLANGVLFAAIHPQGLLAIPALGAIALALSLQREWRGSLIAPMVSHGLNNAVMLGLLLVVTS